MVKSILFVELTLRTEYPNSQARGNAFHLAQPLMTLQKRCIRIITAGG